LLNLAVFSKYFFHIKNKNQMKLTHILVFAAALALTACKNEAATETKQTAQTDSTTVQLNDYEASVEFPNATLKGFKYENGKFSYDYDSSTYKLGQQTEDAHTKLCANSKEGQHLHFIVNDEPYKAFYTQQFENPMNDGTYHLLSFLSRSYHESIKNGKAHLAQKVTFEKGKMTKNEAITAPMLFYSRPKGTYVGADAKRIMLDFFLVNTNLSAEGNKVKVTVNGEEVATVSEWKPYFIDNLPLGKHTITLELIDAQGKTVVAPLNPVTREFELMKEQPAAN
jgi:hypothetical protein